MGPFIFTFNLLDSEHLIGDGPCFEGRIRLNEKRDSIDGIEVDRLTAVRLTELDSVSALIERVFGLMQLVVNGAGNEEWIKHLDLIKVDVGRLEDFFRRTYPREYRMAIEALKRVPPSDVFDK